MWARLWVCLALVTATARGQTAVPDSLLFPRPAGLRSAVDFWKQVFTEYGTDQAVLHDDEDLGLIYGVEELGSRADTFRDQQRRQTQEAILARYQQALERLARGVEDTARLAGEERKVWLALGRSSAPQRYQQARERLRLQVGQQDRFEQGWSVWTRNGDKIRRILRGHGVPDTLAVLPFVESMYNARARSHAGAVGLWQITRPAGRRFLRIDDQVDERLDPLKATHAAAQILLHNRQVLGNWALAITAYNHGTAGVARAVRETGSRDIADLVRRYQGPAFGFASRNFYAEFLAALEVVHRRPRRGEQQVLGAAGVPLDEWILHDPTHTQAKDSAAASAGPAMLAVEAMPGSAPAVAADTAPGLVAGIAEPSPVALEVGAPDTTATPVGSGMPPARGWWQALRLVLSPLRAPTPDCLHPYVALCGWVQGCMQAFATLLAPLYA